MIKGFIFDLDGVITDTAEYHYLAWKKLSDEVGWAFDREVNEKLRGVSRMDSIGIIRDHNQATIEEDALVSMATKKNDYYVGLLNQMTTDDYLPGAKELLTALQNEGFKIALGSASKNAGIVLDKLQATAFFDVIGDGHSVAKSKPAPDIFLFGAKALGLQPEECVVYEDAESGIDAAKTGGFHNVGIGPQERVGHADVRFDTMEAATLSAVKAHFKGLF